jgi:outer membrane protein OmpA-like peptidoglycan-associated protein
MPPFDTDGDGLGDEEERNRYSTDPNNADTDGDNLTDAEEVQKYNTSPNNPDTDGDGLTDGAEALVYNTDPLDFDTDNDLLADGQEVRQYRTDPLLADTDTDQLGDGMEVTRVLSDPLNPDTDGDGVIDGLDRCPTVPGPPENDGCPEGQPVMAQNNQPRSDGPLAGIPEFIEVNDRAEFEGIYFQVNSDNFDFSKPETARNLWQLLQYMEQCDDLGVVLEGHSSTEGNPRWNQTLSERRATRVRDWLLDNGVDRSKILGTIGYGGRLPRVSEPQPGTVSAAALERARAQNRRISALVRKPCK